MNLIPRPYLLLFISSLLFSACNSNHQPGQAETGENYFREVEEWKQSRIESLKEPTGWLRLAGMFILDEGETIIGTSNDADILFPGQNIPDELATITLLPNGNVHLQTLGDETITYNGSSIDSFILYDGENTPSVQFGSLEWHIIIRGDLTAIRLYNKENEKADNFSGFPAYPVDPAWNREAIFTPNPEGTTLSIANVLGQLEDVISPGSVEFTINNEIYTLDALEAGERMFIIVGDQTNQTETYQAGRYIYIDYPVEGSNTTVLDFNKMYNPPCAFNTFTTCQLPHPQNQLDVAITAGEKRPVEWSGL